MDNEEIKSNTCEIIKVDRLFIKDIEKLKHEYHRIKDKIFQEIVQEIMDENDLKNILFKTIK